MKNIKLFLLIFVILLFSACQKDNITVTLKTSGSLSVQISDSTGAKMQNVKVRLFVSGSSENNGELDSKKTDANGSINFGTLQAGSYYVVTDTIRNGNRKYLISKAVQIISGDAKVLVLNPFDYIGTIKLQVLINTSSYPDTLDRRTLRVALVNYKDINSSYNRQKVLSKAVDIKSCDANGNVSFTVPSSIEYTAYVYINDNDTIGAWSGSYFEVTKDNIYSDYFYVSLSSLIVLKANVNLSIQYYSYSPNYTNMPVQLVNVVLVKYSDYSNYNLYSASIAAILSHAVSSGKTNSTGDIMFANIPANIDYRIFVYFDDTHQTWASNYIYPYYGSSNNIDVTVTGSYLGLSK